MKYSHPKNQTYILDITHSEVKKFVSDLFTRLYGGDTGTSKLISSRKLFFR